MFDRTIRTRADTLAIVSRGGVCWSVYRGWRFRIEGDEEKRVYFLWPSGEAVGWAYVWDDGPGATQLYTTNIQGRLGKVIRKSMDFIDGKIREEAKWPVC